MVRITRSILLIEGEKKIYITLQIYFWWRIRGQEDKIRITIKNDNSDNDKNNFINGRRFECVTKNPFHDNNESGLQIDKLNNNDDDNKNNFV